MSLATGGLRLAAIVSAAALATPAAAYLRSSDKGTGKALFWPTPVVPYTVSDAPAAQSPSCKASDAGDPALDAVRGSLSAWDQGCSNLELVFAGRIDEIRAGLDGTPENLVVFRQGWCSAIPLAKACMDSGASDCGNVYDCFEDHTQADQLIVALTSVLYDPDTGRIMNADIEVNGWDGSDGTVSPTASGGPAHGWYFTCDSQVTTLCTTYGQADCIYIDLQNTLTHEAGHFIGLAHPCELSLGNCTPAMQTTTMYPATTPGDVQKRTLSPDDIAGICAIYPSNGGGCGCGSGGAPGAFAALLAVLALRPRRRGGLG